MKAIALGCALTLMMCGDDDVPAEDAGVDVREADGGVDAGTLDAGEAERCVELPLGEEQVVRVELTARIATADIVFLIDSSASMGEEIERIAATLQDQIAPQLAAAIDDVQLAVAEFSDFPQSPYGNSSDVPFRLVQPSTSDVRAVQGAVESLMLRDGADIAESQVVALHQLATGAGLGEFVPMAECPPNTAGYPCFRETGARVVLLFTDAAMHNGPSETAPYDSLSPTPPTYAQMITALGESGIRVLGIYSGETSGPSGRSDLLQVAQDSGAVTDSGDPIVVDIGSRGQDLDTGVVDVVRSLVDEVSVEVALLLEDDDGGLDALDFVDEIRTAGASPMDAAMDFGDRFSAVRPGTQLAFEILLRNSDITEPQQTLLNVVFRDGVTRLSETTIRLVVPTDDVGCP